MKAKKMPPGLFAFFTMDAPLPLIVLYFACLDPLEFYSRCRPFRRKLFSA
jgi:hypothetical protein